METTTMFIINLKKSVLITYLGVIFAVLSMYFAFAKMAFSDVDYMRYSLAFLVLSGVCDMFDGKVARMCKRDKEEKEFGIQIDSLADTVNFVVLPVVIMMSLRMICVWHVIIYAFFIICGISRLGYFNVHAGLDDPVKFYNGLPVTSTAIIYPVLGLLHGQIPDCTFNMIYIVATLITGLLFVVRIKVPKFKGIAYIIIPILAAILVTLLLVIK
jgi:CDP-diacylglycerol--serine O-phosphatidyltransferase